VTLLRSGGRYVIAIPLASDTTSSGLGESNANGFKSDDIIAVSVEGFVVNNDADDPGTLDLNNACANSDGLAVCTRVNDCDINDCAEVPETRDTFGAASPGGPFEFNEARPDGILGEFDSPGGGATAGVTVSSNSLMVSSTLFLFLVKLSFISNSVNLDPTTAFTS
jgi:hypothetical protein